MPFFNLKFIKRSDSYYVLRISLISRIIMLIFSLTVASTFIIDPHLSLLPVMITIILIVTALYEESWSFDSEKKEVISRFGLLFLNRKTVVTFNKIEKFQIEGFVRGSMTEKPEDDDSKKKKLFQTEYFKLSLINNEFGELTINTVKGRERDTLQNYARQIADICKKPLNEQ